MLPSYLLAAAAIFFPCTNGYLLQTPLLDVFLDDVFPAPLNYTLALTNETLRAGLRSADFHVHLSLIFDR